MNKIVSDKYQESYIEETLPNGLKVILWHKEGYEKSSYIIKTISWDEHIAELYKEELKLAKEHHHNYALLDNILLKYRIQEKKKILLPRKATDKQY